MASSLAVEDRGDEKWQRRLLPGVRFSTPTVLTWSRQVRVLAYTSNALSFLAMIQLDVTFTPSAFRVN